jgi:hypothetical protein
MYRFHNIGDKTLRNSTNMDMKLEASVQDQEVLFNYVCPN